MSGWAGLLLYAAQAPALPAADEVRWVAPAGCPDGEALLAGVARRRGRPLEPGRVRVVARTTAVGPRFRLELELIVDGRRERRTLTARTCTALVDAAALRIALAADASPAPVAPPPESPPATPEVGVDAPAEAPVVPLPPGTEAVVVSPAPAAEPAAPPAAVVVAPVAADAPLDPNSPTPVVTLAARRRRVPGGVLRVHGLGEVGALPGPTGGVGLAGGLLWRWARLELQATYLAPRTRSDPRADVRASLFTGAVLGCGRPGRGALELPLCAGLEFGGLVGAFDGAGVQKTALGRWFAVVVGVGAAVRVHPRIGLWAALQGLAAVQRGAFVLRGPGPEVVLFDPGPWSGRVALGVELRFRDPR